jgi:hypothetical protein
VTPTPSCVTPGPEAAGSRPGHGRRRGAWAVAVLAGVALAGPTAAGGAAAPPPDVMRSWIEEMKSSDRGPFDLIRWFCNDGSVRPARAGCRGHGDGVQHGDWNPHARVLRENDYEVANVLVALDPERFTGPHADLDAWRQLLLERFLIGYDSGWIFRGAYGLRGALQIEDEEAAARRLVLAMLADPRWRDPSRYLLLRESVRLLPLSVDETSAAAVRADAMSLATRDPSFGSLRAKIHSFPDAGDAQRVREFAAHHGRKVTAHEFEVLANEIDALYAPQGAAQAVLELAPQVGDAKIAKQLREKSGEFQAEVNVGRRLAAAAKLMELLRNALPRIQDPQVALLSLMTSLALEREAYVAGADAVSKLSGSTRRERLWLLAYSAESLYGTGLIGARSLGEVEAAVRSIESRNPTLSQYREVVDYLGRVPEWCARSMIFQFGPEMQRWSALEPLAVQYTADRLRGSPLLFYGAVLDTLSADADERAGVNPELFGQRVGGGMRALNPGLARGVLRVLDEGRPADHLDPKGIYLLAETTSELSPVAGILTRGEGSSVSHVQLLARNLGIPNVRVHESLVPRLAHRAGAHVVLAVSPGGVVQLVDDGPQWDPIFGAEQQGPADVQIVPDVAKLDLTVTEPLPLSAVGAADAGRVCGPKGANLGALMAAFGNAVPDGFVIPFGAFRRLLDEPIEPGGPSAWDWLRTSYDEIQALPSAARRDRKASEVLARLRDWIGSVPFPPGFEEEVERNLHEHFGRDGSYGVFVRSDTNVEDLKGFTGAGLNQTVPNVVGTENILAAIRQVWASPFTDRAYAWRQAHMSDPEYVFPAVVIQRAFPSEKSGVMITVDVDTGSRRWLTIGVNEGVSGAVDNQAAESLLVDAHTSVIRLLAPAAAPTRKVLAPGGGIEELPASGSEWVLEPSEVRKLVRFAREIPERLPSMRAANGEPIPADVEFGFAHGRLALLQIRPFNESKQALRSLYLAQLDAPVRQQGDKPIWIAGVPGKPDPYDESVKQAEAARRAAAEAARLSAERREQDRKGAR